MAVTTLSGLKLNTPEVNRTFAEGYVADQIAKIDSLTYDNDWKKQEDSPCPMCNGTGKNANIPEDPYCMNCDGTGIEFTLHYGVKGKQSFAYTVEYGVEMKKEFCKAMREAYAEVQLAGKVNQLSLIKPYALPKTIEMEAMAQGFDINATRNNGEVKRIANWVAANYPEFLCVPYTRF